MFHETRMRAAIDGRWMLGVAAAVLLCLTWCRADDPALHKPQGKANQPGGRQNRMLLLISGRIVEGQISQTDGGYVIDKPTGSMLVPFVHVRLEATDRRDAYRKLRKTLPEQTATRHIELAGWCLNQNLLDEARIELRDALLLEPNRSEARSMLRRLEESAHPDKPIHLTPLKMALKTPDGFEPREVQSLAGLSRGSAQQFVSRVQPILMNQCATAGCHGPAARNEFRLTRVGAGRGSHRVFVERNLAVVLRYVDADNPKQSPLLVVPQGSHGRGSRAIFSGPGGSDQMATLAQWVRQVAKERPKECGIRSAKREVRDDAGESGSRSPTSDLQTISGQTRSGEDDLLDRILREERKDAFDPEAFNRAVHGKKSEGK